MKKLLNIDGGGVRVYLYILVLNYIEKKTNKKIVDIFDYFYGVSASAIVLAALLTKYTVSDLIMLFKSKGSSIFQNNSNTSSDALNDNLKDIFNNMKISDIKKPLGILTYDIYTMKPVAFYSYSNNNYNLWEILRASSSDTRYFKPYTIDSYKLIDGSNYSNDVTIIAQNDMIKYFGDMNEYLQLSIGNSSDIFEIIYRIPNKLIKKFYRVEIDSNIMINDIDSFDTMDKIFEEWLYNNKEYIDNICYNLKK
jgi:patatin-like phospholipase/acyl hydrolase